MSSSKPDNNARGVLAAAARYVRTGVRSSAEVRRYLHRHGVSPQTAARVVSEYRASGQLDDRACARLWADHWARGGYAWMAIRAKLSAKGLPSETIAGVTDELGAPAEEMARARQMVVARTPPHPTTRDRARLARTLSGRGFDTDLIERLLNEFFRFQASDAEQ